MSAAIVITDAQILDAVGLGWYCSDAERVRIGRRVLVLASGGAVAPQAPADQPALEKACDLLSMTIGTLMSARSKIGYVDNSPIAKLVGEAVEFLRPWPEKMPEAAPAGVSTTGLAEPAKQ